MDARGAAGLRMHGINGYDLGLVEEADRTFRRAFDLMPVEERAYFMVPTSLRMDGEFLKLYGYDQNAAIQRYWDGQDPSSLDLVNERQLLFWVNTSIAMFYEAEPWRSEFGRAMMLMGPPVSVGIVRFRRPRRQDEIGLRDRDQPPLRKRRHLDRIPRPTRPAVPTLIPEPRAS